MDDKSLYSGLIRLHILHHAAEEPVYGTWIAEELARHGYKLSAGTLYPILHGLESKGYLRSHVTRNGKSARRMYTMTALGRKALRGARQRLQELFGEMFGTGWAQGARRGSRQTQLCGWPKRGAALSATPDIHKRGNGMMRGIQTGLFSLLLVFVSGRCLPAQAPATPAHAMTLEDALDYALQHYPAVRASLEQMSAARAGIMLARSQYLPFLSGVYQDSRATQNQVSGIWLPTAITPTVEGPIGAYSGQSYWGSQAAMLFSWEPFDFGFRSATVGGARSALDKSTADLAVTRLQVATAVGNYFLNALAAQQAVVAAQTNVDRWQVFDQSVHTLVDNALRPGADASRADAQLALAKTQLYQAQAGEQAALATLAALMGMAGSEVQLDAGKLLHLPPVDSLPSSAPADNPLARDQMAVVREAQAKEKVLSRMDYPRIFLGAEAFGRGSDVPDNGSIAGNANGLLPGRGNWVAGLTITFPNVFDFKALSAEKHIAKANERSQQALYDRTIQDVTGQLQTALAQLKSAQLVARQTPIELEAAHTAETQSRARYAASLATLVEVADAESLLAQAEMDDAVARLNVWHNLFNVAYAQGDLQPFLSVLRAPNP